MRRAILASLADLALTAPGTSNPGGPTSGVMAGTEGRTAGTQPGGAEEGDIEDSFLLDEVN